MTDRTALVAGASSRAMFRAPVGAFNLMSRGPQVAYAPEDDAGSANLSVADAVSLLDSLPDEPDDAPVEKPAKAAKAAPAQADDGGDDDDEIEADTTAESEASEAYEPGDGDEDEAEADEPEVPGVEAPAWWKAEHKALFATLPPEVQAVVRDQEAQRERIVSEAKGEAAETRKVREQEHAKTAALAERLSQFLPRAVQTFESRWADVDWVKYAEESPNDAFRDKLRYDEETAELQRLTDAAAEANALQQQNFIRTQAMELRKVAPDLVDPKKGAARRTELAKFITDQGVPRAALQHMSAAEMSMAYDAMRFRKGQAGLRTTTTKPSAPKAGVKPSATPPISPKSKPIIAAKNRFMRSGSVNDAVAWLDSMEP